MFGIVELEGLVEVEDSEEVMIEEVLVGVLVGVVEDVGGTFVGKPIQNKERNSNQFVNQHFSSNFQCFNSSKVDTVLKIITSL